MIFCPKCGSILIPKKENDKVSIKCHCGYAKENSAPIKVREIMKDGREIEAVEEEHEIHPLTHDVECPKCGNKSAYYWEIQTRASDEPATKFMKCEKCKYIWRDYK